MYSVVNTASGKVHAAKTTHAKAVKQMRLLYALEKNPGMKRRDPEDDTSSDEDVAYGFLDEKVYHGAKRAADTKRAQRRAFERRSGVKHRDGWP